MKLPLFDGGRCVVCADDNLSGKVLELVSFSARSAIVLCWTPFTRSWGAFQSPSTEDWVAYPGSSLAERSTAESIGSERPVRAGSALAVFSDGGSLQLALVVSSFSWPIGQLKAIRTGCVRLLWTCETFQLTIIVRLLWISDPVRPCFSAITF